MATWKLVLIFGDDNNSTNGDTEEVIFEANESEADKVATEIFNTTDADNFYVDYISG